MKTKTQDATAGHTPGPWTVGHLDDEGGYTIGNGSRFIAYVGPSMGSALSSQASTIAMNAALIASAPQLKSDRDTLLAALGSIIESWDNGTIPSESKKAAARTAYAFCGKIGSQF